MIYCEKVKIPLKDVEKGNVISDRGLLEIFENVATHHSDMLNDGVNEISKKGKAWVIMDWKIKVLDRPKYSDEFNIITWSRENNITDKKISTYRDFEMKDSDGNILVIATTKWILMDITTGRISNIDKELQQLYEPEEKSVFGNWDIEKVCEANEYSYETEYVVTREDVDFNNHMHNIYYMNLAYNALPEEVYEKRPFNSIRISYKREIKLKDKVKLKYSYVDNKHIVIVKDASETKVHSIIVLE